MNTCQAVAPWICVLQLVFEPRCLCWFGIDGRLSHLTSHCLFFTSQADYVSDRAGCLLPHFMILVHDATSQQLTLECRIYDQRIDGRPTVAIPGRDIANGPSARTIVDLSGSVAEMERQDQPYGDPSTRRDRYSSFR